MVIGLTMPSASSNDSSYQASNTRYRSAAFAGSLLARSFGLAAGVSLAFLLLAALFWAL
jgi:hypothetical protein